MLPVEVSPFRCAFCRIIDELGGFLDRLWLWPFDMFLSCFMPTTQDKKTPLYRLLYCIITIPITLLLSILTLPCALIGACLWLSVARFREPYRYSYVPSSTSSPLRHNYTIATLNLCLLPEVASRFNNMSHTSWRAVEIGRNLAAQQSQFLVPGASSTNGSCTKSHTEAHANGSIPAAAPEQHSNGDLSHHSAAGIGRAGGRSLMSNDSGRYSTQGGSLMDDSFDDSRDDSLDATDTSLSNAADVSSSVHTQDETVLDTTQERLEDGGYSSFCQQVLTTAVTTERRRGGSDDQFPELQHDVLTRFPPTQFLLFQEAWSLHHSRNLAQQLHKVYPHILYDAGEYSWRRLFGSGLMIASQYPFENVRFDPFTHGVRQCAIASKGCLHAKVYLGNMPDGRRVVGYLHATHLQAYSGKVVIVPRQMDELLIFMERFRQQTQSQDDVVAFDLLGGDFNSDNMSPIHREDYHHRLFSTYIDVCRIRPGLDHDWAVGTDMRHLTMNDDLIKTPEGLKRALDDPILRQYYIIDADAEHLAPDMAWKLPRKDQHGEWVVSPVGGKRRIDYILCRIDSHVGVRACQPVTQLAGLIDHIAYTINIDTKLA